MNIVRHLVIASIIIFGTLSTPVAQVETQTGTPGPLQVLWQFEAGG